jgi:hypothetical protein
VSGEGNDEGRLAQLERDRAEALASLEAKRRRRLKDAENRALLRALVESRLG